MSWAARATAPFQSTPFNFGSQNFSRTIRSISARTGGRVGGVGVGVRRAAATDTRRTTATKKEFRISDFGFRIFGSSNPQFGIRNSKFLRSTKKEFRISDFGFRIFGSFQSAIRNSQL